MDGGFEVSIHTAARFHLIAAMGTRGFLLQ